MDPHQPGRFAHTIVSIHQALLGRTYVLIVLSKEQLVKCYYEAKLAIWELLETLRELAEGFAGPVHTVKGNDEGDVLLLTRVAQQVGNVTMHGEYAELEMAGRRVAMVHYPRLAEGLAALGDYDLVCHGHDHQARIEQVGNTLLLDPGEVMGWKGRPSCAIYDTETGKAQIVQL